MTTDTKQAGEQEQGLTTPRPWKASEFAIYGANGVPAAHTGGCERSNTARKANAELIATAVNERSALLERVQKLERFITQMSGLVHASSHGEPFETCSNGLCKAARAALENK